MPAANAQREFDFTSSDFERIRHLVRRHAGISMAESKRELVYGRLVRRLRQLRLDSFGAYLQRVEEGDPAEVQQFCNALTTNLTSFFREQHHFDWLTRTCLPHLEASNAATRRIRIWSAGCSTGEEPYSIAMVVLETLGHLRGWDIRILATDIDSDVLARARRGVYDAERVARMDPKRLSRWFALSGEQFSVGAEPRRLISFKPLNLIGEWPFKGPFDIIFCRNVIIYFDKDTQRNIIGHMAGMQRAGDHLVLGHSESLLGVSTVYESAGQTIHRKAR
ncbi:MAG: protein-glutamate O-methyltransferase CheR [Steroidobacteraceae bacterium]